MCPKINIVCSVSGVRYYEKLNGCIGYTQDAPPELNYVQCPLSRFVVLFCVIILVLEWISLFIVQQQIATHSIERGRYFYVFCWSCCTRTDLPTPSWAKIFSFCVCVPSPKRSKLFASIKISFHKLISLLLTEFSMRSSRSSLLLSTEFGQLRIEFQRWKIFTFECWVLEKRICVAKLKFNITFERWFEQCQCRNSEYNVGRWFYFSKFVICLWHAFIVVCLRWLSSFM